jgi:hypothetical protein
MVMEQYRLGSISASRSYSGTGESKVDVAIWPGVPFPLQRDDEREREVARLRELRRSINGKTLLFGELPRNASQTSASGSE